MVLARRTLGVAGVLAQSASLRSQSWRAVRGLHFRASFSASGILKCHLGSKRKLWPCGLDCERYNLGGLEPKKEIPFDR